MKLARRLKNMYKLSLDILGKEHKSTGKTIQECFENLPLKWNEIKTKGIVRVSDGKKEYERAFTLPIIRRIMVNSVARTLWAKRIEAGLK
jgi:hypothetical protein